jgi:solute carrier family 25 carnitine/acylcarnitine transporter 20/29
MPPQASPPVWTRFLAGSASGAALVLVGHPLDTLRVQLQTGASSSLRAAAASVFKAHGLLGFYRGFAPPLLLTGLVNTVLWGCTFAVSDALQREGLGSATSRAVLAAIPASLLSSLIVAPMEGLKTRQQTAPGPRVPLAALLRQVLQQEGLRGLYRGWTVVVFARSSGGFAYFGGNSFFLGKLNSEWLPPGDSSLARTRNTLLAGGLAGIGFWLPALPFDVVKTRMMASGSAHQSPVSCAKALLAEAGPLGFYKGFSAAILRAFPANAAAFTAFDLTMRALS